MKVARLFSIAVTVFRRTDVFLPGHLQKWRLPDRAGIEDGRLQQGEDGCDTKGTGRRTGCRSENSEIKEILLM